MERCPAQPRDQFVGVRNQTNASSALVPTARRGKCPEGGPERGFVHQGQFPGLPEAESLSQLRVEDLEIPFGSAGQFVPLVLRTGEGPGQTRFWRQEGQVQRCLQEKATNISWRQSPTADAGEALVQVAALEEGRQADASPAGRNCQRVRHVAPGVSRQALATVENLSVRTVWRVGDGTGADGAAPRRGVDTGAHRPRPRERAGDASAWRRRPTPRKVDESPRNETPWRPGRIVHTRGRPERLRRTPTGLPDGSLVVASRNPHHGSRRNPVTAASSTRRPTSTGWPVRGTQSGLQGLH